ncbi:MAG: lipid A 4'-phosphatase [Cyclobacteriaceae bacterium]|nr:MAG: lipid A 4'-phosphatase [Cyclobacteriaceae bacterium]
MLRKLLEADQELLLAINKWHAPWLDPVMLLLTKTLVWLPLYLLLLYAVIKVYKKRFWIPLLAVAVTLTLTDRITSGWMKPYFARLRPSHNPELAGKLHLVDGYTGGLYGFASSHAANSFGVALLLWLLFHKFFPQTAWLFAWALFMSYTRLYLGVHYPGDILVGAVTGLLCATTVYHFLKSRLTRLTEDEPVKG